MTQWMLIFSMSNAAPRCWPVGMPTDEVSSVDFYSTELKKLKKLLVTFLTLSHATIGSSQCVILADLNSCFNGYNIFCTALAPLAIGLTFLVTHSFAFHYLSIIKVSDFLFHTFNVLNFSYHHLDIPYPIVIPNSTNKID